MTLRLSNFFKFKKIFVYEHLLLNVRTDSYNYSSFKYVHKVYSFDSIFYPLGDTKRIDSPSSKIIVVEDVTTYEFVLHYKKLKEANLHKSKCKFSSLNFLYCFVLSILVRISILNGTRVGQCSV